MSDHRGLICTQRSFLRTYNFVHEDLLQQCISDIADKLRMTNGRYVGFFSDTAADKYQLKGQTIARTQPLTPALRTLLDHINTTYRADCNGILVNKYADGTHTIMRHSDSKNHADIGVLILSSGATRTLKIYKKKAEHVADVPLVHGQIVHMGGEFQQEFEHAIERENSVGERISFSFHKYMGLGY